jgi:thioredoxin-like negative regulator of GroEL
LALTALARVQKLAPDDYRPYHLAGLIQVDGENFGLANEEFRQALQRNPPGDIEVAIRMELVRSLVRILNYRAAIDVLEDLRPSVERSALLAECQWALGSKEQAAALIEETLQTTAPSNK